MNRALNLQRDDRSRETGNVRAHSSPGFTVLEVILAVAIATGLLVVALQFYQQAADLRRQLLQESERVSTIRLLLDRLSADLRGAFVQPQQGFDGGPMNLQFLKTDVLSRPAWTVIGDRSGAIETDLKLVSYGVNRAADGTNLVIAGITRIERPFAGASFGSSKTALTGAVPATNLTNQVSEPITEDLHFLRFRYWDGSNWLDSWSDSALPQGVEVSLGVEPLPQDELPEDYSREIFRRIIWLPGSGANEETTNPKISGPPAITAQNP
jgi:type II secretory pathway pseudopilin PulG